MTPGFVCSVLHSTKRREGWPGGHTCWVLVADEGPDVDLSTLRACDSIFSSSVLRPGEGNDRCGSGMDEAAAQVEMMAAARPCGGGAAERNGARRRRQRAAVQIGASAQFPAARAKGDVHVRVA